MVKIEDLLFSVFAGGLALFFSTISIHLRGKHCKTHLYVFQFLLGSAPFFNIISAFKTVNILFFLPFLPGGRPLFNTISAVRTVDIEKENICGIVKGYPFAKTTLAKQLSTEPTVNGSVGPW